MTSKLLAAAAASLLSLAGAAGAATFDFQNLAEGSGVGEGSWASRGDYSGVLGDFDNATDTFTVGGIGVVATGTARASAYAYLDSGVAGLGVCAAVDGSNQCDPSNDDNVDDFEQLILTFDQSVSLSSMILRATSHALFSGDVFIANLTGMVSGYFAAGDDLSVLGSGTMFRFENDARPDSDGGCGGREAQTCEFYLSSLTVTPSEVPLPAAGFLLLGGLGGLAAMKRRKSA